MGVWPGGRGAAAGLGHPRKTPAQPPGVPWSRPLFSAFLAPAPGPWAWKSKPRCGDLMAGALGGAGGGNAAPRAQDPGGPGTKWGADGRGGREGRWPSGPGLSQAVPGAQSRPRLPASPACPSAGSQCGVKRAGYLKAFRQLPEKYLESPNLLRGFCLGRDVQPHFQ